MVLFCYTVALTAVTKAETLVFWLRSVQIKNSAMMHGVELRLSAQCIICDKKVLSVTLRYATQYKIKVKNILFDSALCIIERSQ
jgi:hypothetical protein